MNEDSSCPDDLLDNCGKQFDRLPATDADRRVSGRPSRSAVLDWWENRYGVPADVFTDYTFWEKGAGSLWAVSGTEPNPLAIETIGIRFIRARQKHWKPTTNAVQRFGHHATKNVIDLSKRQAACFFSGQDIDVDWSGDWGYLIVRRPLAGEAEPIGVGLYTHGILQSQIPKGRRRNLRPK